MQSHAEYERLIESLENKRFDAETKVMFARYRAAQDAMAAAWIRGAWKMTSTSLSTFTPPPIHHLSETIVSDALKHAAGDPSCSIWVNVCNFSLTAWPSFEAPEHPEWFILEDFSDDSSVPSGWHSMNYHDRLRSLLENQPIFKEEWEYTLQELCFYYKQKQDFSSQLSREYLQKVAKNPEP